MDSKYKIGIIGLGSLGAAYGSMALDNNFNVSFICDESRKHKYATLPFTVNGKSYDFECISDTNNYFDLILITVKIQQLRSALQTLAKFKTENTIIISVINGITSEGIIQESLPTSKVIHGYTVKTDGQRDGHQFSYSNRGRIVFGALNEELKSWADQAELILKAANIPHQHVDNIEYKIWWKLMLNVGINQSSAILSTPYGEYQNQHVQQVAAAAMMEVVDISRAAGVNLSESDVFDCFSIFNSLDPNNKTSMLQDLQNGRPTEVDIFAGEIIKLGKQYGISTPINTFLYHSIKYLESKQLETSVTH